LQNDVTQCDVEEAESETDDILAWGTNLLILGGVAGSRSEEAVIGTGFHMPEAFGRYCGSILTGLIKVSASAEKRLYFGKG
jgi:hypothetical protein